MAVSDCHQAIQATLTRESSELSGDVVLVADAYGAFVAASLAAKYPAWYKTLILRNPLVDLSAAAQSDQLLYWEDIQSCREIFMALVFRLLHNGQVLNLVLETLVS